MAIIAEDSMIMVTKRTKSNPSQIMLQTLNPVGDILSNFTDPEISTLEYIGGLAYMGNDTFFMYSLDKTIRIVCPTGLSCQIKTVWLGWNLLNSARYCDLNGYFIGMVSCGRDGYYCCVNQTIGLDLKTSQAWENVSRGVYPFSSTSRFDYGSWDYYAVVEHEKNQIIVDYSVDYWSRKIVVNTYPVINNGSRDNIAGKLTLIKFVYSSTLRMLFAFLVDENQVLYLVYFNTFEFDPNYTMVGSFLRIVHPLELLWNIKERLGFSFSVMIIKKIHRL